MIGIEGHVRLVVSTPGRDGIDADTGWVKNIVCMAGVEAILALFAGGTGAGKLQDSQDFDGTYACKLALGTGGTGSPPSYDDFDIPTELADAGYARQTVGAASVRLGANDEGTPAVWTWGGGIEQTDKTKRSGLKFSASWTAGFVSQTRNIDVVGLYGSAGAYVYAQTAFTAISVGTSQQVDATYIISIKQAA